MRYFVHLAYHGKNYHGWQRQPNASSVQQTIEHALQVLLRKPTEVVGCGRTDTGVHASSYFLHFETDALPDTDHFTYQLNAILPHDIAIYKVFEVLPEMHARFSATEREYQYFISTLPDPFDVDTSYLYTRTLDIAAMNEAAALLLRYTDFECFSKLHTDVKTFLCEVRFAQWEQHGSKLVFTIRADRFLRNMVRAIVGTLMEVGKGKLTIEGFEKVLQSQNRNEAGESVPAKGLFLTQVSYQ